MFTKPKLKNEKSSRSKLDITGFFSFSFTALAVILSFAAIVFVVYKSIYFFEAFGWDFIVKSEWRPPTEFGVWNFVVSTFWVVLLTMLLVFFINFFSSVFISQFLPSWLKNRLIFILKVFSGIPSILFGVFGAFVLVNLFKNLGIEQPKSMLAVIFVLTLMVLPTTLSLTIDLLESVPNSYKLSGLALGIKRIHVAFDIIYKSCSRRVFMIMFFGFSRAIGEVTAVALIAGNGLNAPNFSEGFMSFFFQSITTLSSLIGLEIAENYGRLHESALFGVAVLIMLIVFVVNLFFFFVLERHYKNFIPVKLKSNFFHRFYNKKVSNYFVKYLYFYHQLVFYLRWIFMIFTFGILFVGLGWVVGDIIFRGVGAFIANNGEGFKNLITSSGNNGLLGVIVTTLILILGSLTFATPIAFFTAVYLNEYAPYSSKHRWIARFVRFIVYQLASSPTIIFGLFGLALFVSLFGFGYTLLAASLTMILIIFPIMVQTILQNFKSVPINYRQAAFALGLTRQSVIWRVVVPAALNGIVVSWILAANKVIAESAPMLVILGNTAFFPSRGFFSSGRTLATHIYFLQSESLLSGEVVERLTYQTALFTLLLIFLTNFLIVRLTKRMKKK